jgi:hypothetical protein
VPVLVRVSFTSLHPICGSFVSPASMRLTTGEREIYPAFARTIYCFRRRLFVTFEESF